MSAVRGFLCLTLAAAASSSLGGALEELLPMPREAVRRYGEVDAVSVPTTVRRVAVPDAPAETADEAYVLEVTPTGTVITASSERGERWAHVTLDQLARLAGGRIPCCRIVDWPQFRWRGFMHDSARNFLELEDVKGLIDIMSRAKLNLFHWHLTEYYGWRLESKRYPELQKDGAFFRRYIGKYYRQDEFREILDYARARGVTVMPEFDVPGHALAFRRAFGFKTMRDAGVREKLCDLVDELCALAPPELMPFVHIGSDEASAPDEKVPSGWLEPIVDRIRAAGRMVVGWMPGELNGLSGSRGIIGMRWGKDPEKGIPCFDACGMYVDTMDPFEFLGVTTYRRVCPWSEADGARLGAITCAWHDDFAGEGRRTICNQALVPALVMSADAYWCGRDNRKAGGTCRVLPRGDDPSLADAAAFERRMVAQRDKVYADVPYPFQFLCQTAMRWRVTRPDGSLVAKDVAGATLSFWQVWLGKDENLLRGERMGTVIAETWIRSPKDQDVGAWIGFTDYNRNHGRACSGPTPALGQWNKHGASVTINGEKVEPPKWKRPGQTSGPAVKEIEGVHELDEIPFEDEEYYMRAPTKIHLRKGWNRVRLTVPMTEKTGYYRPWTATFAPLLGTTERPKEVPDLEYGVFKGQVRAPGEEKKVVFPFKPTPRRRLF